MNNKIEILLALLRQESILFSGEKAFFEGRYGKTPTQVKHLAKLMGWPRDQLLDHARGFLKERALLSLMAKSKLRFWGDQINIYEPAIGDPRSEELSSSFNDCSENYLEIRKMYDQYAMLLQSILTDIEFEGLRRDVAEEILKDLTKDDD